MGNFLKRLGAEFWLPLPFLGILFWLGTTALTAEVLKQANEVKQPIETDHKVQIQLSTDVVSIEAEIKVRDRFTKVFIQTGDPVVKKLELEFPVTEIEEIDRAIAQQFNLSPETVHHLTRYHYDYQ